MKTAMQNHIADMKKIQEMVKSKNIDKDLEETILESIEGCIENAESFLEAEKEQIMDIMNRNDEAKRLLKKCWEIIPLDSRKWNNVFLEVDEFLKK